jgi:hypothetical protein
MATRYVKKDFTLNRADGTNKNYYVGDKIEGEDAKHWYAKAHSEESKQEMENSLDRDPVRDRNDQRVVALQLMDGEKVPSVENLNKALKEANLPPIKNAADRDALLAEAQPSQTQTDSVEQQTQQQDGAN